MAKSQTMKSAATGEANMISAAFPYQKQRRRVLGREMAYVEVGEGDPIVLLHGNPTSSYLWRNVLPYLQPLGRCIAPDLIGMGDSDKLPDSGPDRYTFVEHRRFLDGLLEAVGVDDRGGCYPVVQARSTACYPSGQIMTANYDRVAARPVVAAIARTPYAPALFEQRTLVDGCSQHLGIGEHDVLRQLFALWCKADSTAADATDAATPVHERIEHQPEEGCHHLKRWLLSAGRDLAREERQRTGEVAACQTKQGEEIRR